MSTRTICLQDGDIAYVPEPLNIHRRHQNSATHLAKGSAHIDEIKKVHAYLEEAYGSDDVSGDRRGNILHFCATNSASARIV